MKVVVSVGEVSGDKHLADVVKLLRQQNTEIVFRGMAGEKCQEAGVKLLIDSYSRGAKMGLSDVALTIPKILRDLKAMKRLLREWRPELLVVVDYPDFNLRLAKYAKSLGIKVLYFIPPKVWAWRRYRIKQLSERTDQIAAIFPFETEFYRKHGVLNVTYVGNPVVDQCDQLKCIGKAVTEVTRENQTLVLLPGSRRGEVSKILPAMVRIYGKALAVIPTLKVVVVVAPNMNREGLRNLLANNSSGRISEEVIEKIKWSDQAAPSVMAGATAGLLKSGTCNVEAALVGLPFVSIYSGTTLNSIMVNALVTLKEFSLVNIIRPNSVPEFMQVKLDEESIFQTLLPLLQQSEQRQRQVQALRETREVLACTDGTQTSIRLTVAENMANLVQSFVK